MRRRVLVSLSLLAILGGLASVAFADGIPLKGTVGPGFFISLNDANDATVSHVDPGSYTLDVDDKSDMHNFHLVGPGVDVSTPVDGILTQAFALTLVDGKYSFFCDAHPLTMKGSFTVGAVTLPPPTTTPAPAPKRLTLVVTDKAVSLKSGASAVRRLGAGPYVVAVTDRSTKQNVHLVGAGVNRRTGIAFVGTVTWKVTLKSGTLSVRSDAKRPTLRPGTIAVA
jgi:hypothetical protein